MSSKTSLDRFRRHRRLVITIASPQPVVTFAPGEMIAAGAFEPTNPEPDTRSSEPPAPLTASLPGPPRRTFGESSPLRASSCRDPTAPSMPVTVS
jgi:hypothetical protein